MVCHRGRPRRWVTLLIPSFDQPTWLPHDLAYYVVERALGLTHGFRGCVARGAVFSGMEVLKGRQAPHAATRSREILREMAASQQGTEAEVLVDFFVRLTQQGWTPGGAAQPRNIWQRSQIAPALVGGA